MDRAIRIGSSDYVLTSDDDYLREMGDEFEPHMTQLFAALVAPSDVVADIGANIGLTAIALAAMASHVIAFEPSPSTYGILANNLSRANIKNVHAVNVGLGRQQGRHAITYARHNRSGAYVSDKIRPVDGYISEQITVDTLDHYFDRHSEAPNFLKIDVEGFEQNVIAGGLQLLQFKRPVVVMELNHYCLNVLQRITLPDFVDFMRSKFPYLYAIDSDNTTIADLHEAEAAYHAMHAHVVHGRFLNLVGGFETSIKSKLDALASRATTVANLKHFNTPPTANAAGTMQTVTVPRSVAAGSMFDVSVAIQNGGTETWYGYGVKPVRLSYHWMNADGSYAVYDGKRTELKSGVVRPGAQIQEVISVVAPSRVGTCTLILTLVQESICWFEDQGFAPRKCKVKIRPAVNRGTALQRFATHIRKRWSQVPPQKRA